MAGAMGLCGNGTLEDPSHGHLDGYPQRHRVYTLNPPCAAGLRSFLQVKPDRRTFGHGRRLREIRPPWALRRVTDAMISMRLGARKSVGEERPGGRQGEAYGCGVPPWPESNTKEITSRRRAEDEAKYEERPK